MKKMPFVVNKKIYYVEYIVTTNKNMYLKLTRENVIQVSAPKNIAELEVRKFVQENISNFVKHFEKKDNNQLYSVQKSTMLYKGKWVKLVYLSGFDKVSYKIMRDKIYINTKRSNEDEIKFVIKKILLDETKKYMNSFQVKFEKQMEIPKYETTYTYRHSSWGINNTRKKNISYSTKLAHFNDDVKDYLIVHELSHHFEHNHSQAFWNIVNTHCPNYKELRNILNKYKD